MKTTEIRRVFLDYFRDHKHQIVVSSSLVPANDPTLLFTNAGMVQFKDVFLGLDQRPYRRATTAQRCVRAGGKHNDLDNVGYTARHHTFFEMLGNFSFGEYFKSEAIHMCWDLLTNVYRLPAERLWVTVFEDDDEAADIWLHEIGVPAERFSRIGGKPGGDRYDSDNFWAMGDTGPCGPCSEVFYDHGPAVAGGPPGTPEADGDRYIEIWNLVFMQYNRDASGAMQPLPKPSVDTGMGLERLAAILQGVHSNYEIDLFQNLIRAAAGVLNVTDLSDKSLRVIADHIRSSAFLITDGVMPSNEGRGYVLRRIIRRAIRHGYRLGCTTAFFHRLVEPLVAEMGDACPELVAAAGRVEHVLRTEGEKFAETLEQGLKLIDREIATLTGNTVPGEVVFRLYDTYGFPVDLTADVAREHSLAIDLEGFDAAMAAQRERARAASQFRAIDQPVAVTQDLAATPFTGYQGTDLDTTVVRLIQDNREIACLTAGESAIVVLDSTPFYAESGGQNGDNGRLAAGETAFDVSDTRTLANKVIGHFGHLRSGVLKPGDTVRAEVDRGTRSATANNHSATHLLHATLKQILGPHVQQKGSLVQAARLRFDFSHDAPLGVDQLRRIEQTVNAQVRANNAVLTRLMPVDAACAAGAEALFGEKYDAEVRVVGMGEFSLELCGGTHARRTGDLGAFKIVSETGIAAGVRRIEALTGQGAVDYIEQREAVLAQMAHQLRAAPDAAPVRLRQLQERVRQLERENQALHQRVASGADAGGEPREVGGVKLITLRQNGADARALRGVLDRLKNQLGSGVVVVGSERDGKASLVVGVTPDLNGRVHAGRLIQAIAPEVDGRGGGRPDMAQGGGPRVAGLGRALAAVDDALAVQLGG